MSANLTTAKSVKKQEKIAAGLHAYCAGCTKRLANKTCQQGGKMIIPKARPSCFSFKAIVIRPHERAPKQKGLLTQTSAISA